MIAKFGMLCSVLMRTAHHPDLQGHDRPRTAISYHPFPKFITTHIPTPHSVHSALSRSQYSRDYTSPI